MPIKGGVGKPGFWSMPVPQECDICGNAIGATFVDGKTRPGGQWGIMCDRCHRLHGVGLGTGKGQKYDSKTREKIDG